MSEAFQLKIQLKWTDPKIWRRVIVPTSMTLRDLHDVIQAAMGWEDYHMHQFLIKKKRYQEPPEKDLWGYFDEGRYEDENEFTLKDVLYKGLSFSYTYDFGDDWIHLIRVEKKEVTAPDNLPVCIGGELAGPPEDCGGVGGYYSLLEIRDDPEYEDHYDLLEWSRNLNPNDFDLERVNELIKQRFTILC